VEVVGLEASLPPCLPALVSTTVLVVVVAVAVVIISPFDRLVKRLFVYGWGRFYSPFDRLIKRSFVYGWGRFFRS